MMYKRPWRDLLEFNRGQRMGVLVLGGLCIFLFSALQLATYFESPLDGSAQLELEKELALLTIDAPKSGQEGVDFRQGKSQTDSEKGRGWKKKKLSDPFDFDPNTVTKEELVLLGFSEKQAQSIINYRDKGGVIRKTEDFKKIYVVNDFMYERLADHIVIDIQKANQAFEESKAKRSGWKKYDRYSDVSDSLGPTTQRFETKPKATERSAPLDLNTATAEELIALPGIGPIYSKRILKYREMLGGYVSVTQLGEVYGLMDHPDVVSDLSSRLLADPKVVAKRNINEDDWKTLVSHPYIDKKIANAIIALREQHGPFSEVEGLRMSHLVDDDLFAKIAPYLTIDGHQ